MNNKSKAIIVDNYRNLFLKYGDSPEAVQFGSRASQLFRFEQLVKIADLKGARILDIGCGLGDLYPFLSDRFGEVEYMGIDIVSETVAFAAEHYPQARFKCHDILGNPLDEKFDYVLINSVFNNNIPDGEDFIQQLIVAGYEHCTQGMAFNFISTYVNFREVEMYYHDPVAIFDFCIQRLSRRVSIHHHYQKCDVAVFVYR